MELVEMLRQAVAMGGSDVFLIPGSGLTVKVNNDMKPLSEGKLLPADTEMLVRKMYEMAHRDFSLLDRDGDDDFSFAILKSVAI